MKKIQYLTLGLISLMAVACGGNKNEGASSSANSSSATESNVETNTDAPVSSDQVPTEVKLNVESEIGDLGNYLSFPEKNVSLTYAGGKVKGAIKVNVNRTVCSTHMGSFDFDIQILDKNNQKIETIRNFFKLKSKVKSGPDTPAVEGRYYSHVVESGSLIVEGKKTLNDKKWEKIAKEGKSINIVLNFKRSYFLPYPK